MGTERFGAGVTLSWDHTRMAVAAKFDGGEATARETLSVLHPSTAGTSTYNARYLSAAMRCIRSEVVTMFCEDGRAPSVWRGDDESFVVLMPMRGAHEDIAASLLTSLQAGNRLDEALFDAPDDAARARWMLNVPLDVLLRDQMAIRAALQRAGFQP
eukprot:gene19418-24828_t